MLNFQQQFFKLKINGKPKTHSPISAFFARGPHEKGEMLSDPFTYLQKGILSSGINLVPTPDFGGFTYQ